jgi:DNA-binding winged helix-turn-helix (wHTH) protein
LFAALAAGSAKFLPLVWVAMAPSSYKFGEFELDCARYELRRNGRILKLERIPMELLILLAEKDGHVVSRQEIIERLWGKDVLVDTEHGINTAIRKIRSLLQEDAERPRFVITVLGKGYRLVAEQKNGDARLARGLSSCRLSRSSTSCIPTNVIVPS